MHVFCDVYFAHGCTKSMYITTQFQLAHCFTCRLSLHFFSPALSTLAKKCHRADQSTPALSTPVTSCRIVYSRIGQPCHIVPICPLLQSPPLPHGAELSTPAFSTPPFLTVPLCHSRKCHQPIKQTAVL